MKHENLPLFTPELIKSEPFRLLEFLPSFIAMAAFVDEIGETDGTSNPLVVAFGGKYKKAHTMTALQFSVVRETTRLGNSIATNSNFMMPRPKVYTKISFRDAPQDNMPLARLFAGAGANEAVRCLEIASDLRPENLGKFGAGKPSKSAVKVVREHVRRLANEREAGGTFPADFTKDEYLENFDTLLVALEEEAGQFFSQKDVA